MTWTAARCARWYDAREDLLRRGGTQADVDALFARFVSDRGEPGAADPAPGPASAD